jgi:hypothetical protein
MIFLRSSIEFQEIASLIRRKFDRSEQCLGNLYQALSEIGRESSELAFDSL